jgi:ascorbate-specific PTS system EIIC-type component UlaA
MSYEHDLAFNLRQRGLPESQLAEVIDEVRAHTATTGASAEAEFGTAEQYAASFPAVKRRSRGHRVVAVAVLLAIAYALASLVLKALIGFDIKFLTGPVTLWPALVIVGAGLLGGFLIDYLRPTPRTTGR